MFKNRILIAAAVLTLAFVLVSAGAAFAGIGPSPFRQPVSLGSTAPFALFSRGGVLTSGPGTATCNGDAGVYFGSLNTDSVAGAPSPISGIQVNGATHINDAVAATAAIDMDKAWNDAWSRPQGTMLFGETSGTLLSGVYDDGDAANTIIISGTLTLDAQGDPEATWIFRTHSGLVFAPDARIVLANGARFCRVFWVAGDANIGPNAAFVGHLFSEHDIAVAPGAVITGQLLAGAGSPEGPNRGAIILSGNTITNGPCSPRLPRTGYPPAPLRADLPVAIGALVAMALVLLPLKRYAKDL